MSSVLTSIQTYTFSSSVDNYPGSGAIWGQLSGERGGGGGGGYLGRGEGIPPPWVHPLWISGNNLKIAHF